MGGSPDSWRVCPLCGGVTSWGKCTSCGWKSEKRMGRELGARKGKWKWSRKLISPPTRKCETCGGRGWIAPNWMQPCLACMGRGVAR